MILMIYYFSGSQGVTSLHKARTESTQGLAHPFRERLNNITLHVISTSQTILQLSHHVISTP